MLWQAGKTGLMVQPGRSLFVTEQLLTASLVSEGYTFNDVYIGSPARDDRTVLVAVTCRDAAAFVAQADGAIEIGGLGLTRRNSIAWALSDGSDMGCYLFSDVLGAGYGEFSALTIASISNGTQIDSLGVTVWATHLEGNALVEGGTDIGNDTTVVFNNISTANGGYIVGAVAMSVSSNSLSSFSGNGSTGALTEIVDSAVVGNHRHAAVMKTGLSAGTTEDFTGTTASAAGVQLAVLSSRQ